MLNKEFKIAFKRVLHCTPRILVHNSSGNFGNQPGQRARVGRGLEYTQSFSGSMNQAGGDNLTSTKSGKSKLGMLS